MDIAGVLDELYGRIPPLARGAVEGLDTDTLVAAPGPRTNPIAWLVWHSARVQDHHVGELLEADQLWQTGPWAARFGLDPDPQNTGYGHDATAVARVRPADPDVLVEYLDAVSARTADMLRGLTPADLDRIVDRRWHRRRQPAAPRPGGLRPRSARPLIRQARENSRRTRPGRAPVSSPCSVTTSPLTSVTA
jgi:hypothetical protein